MSHADQSTSLVSKLRAVPWRKVRRWVYGVALAAGGVLAYCGLIKPEAVPILLPLVLALFNTSPAPTPDEATS